jgi:phosphoribosyl 1,2-cyclic phosphodiesterase
LKVKFWGTRGSLPQALGHSDVLSLVHELLQESESQGIRTLRTFKLALDGGKFTSPISYGGNTTCTEIIHGSQNFFVDMGSGLREAGTFYMPKGVKEFHIFLTHMHWDHIMGMPFFVPIHVPGYKVKIYHVHRNAPEHVKINFNGINFPLTWEQLAGQIEFVQMKLYEPMTFDDVKVTPFVLDHPGGSFGFRFDAGGKSCVVGVDGEFKRITPSELGRDLSFYQNLDLLVFDAQYEISELANRFDWGHCSPNIGVDLALRECIKTLAFTHHDPWATPAKLRRMYAGALNHRKAQLPAFAEQWQKVGQPDGPKLITAWDSLVIDLDNP